MCDYTTLAKDTVIVFISNYLICSYKRSRNVLGIVKEGVDSDIDEQEVPYMELERLADRRADGSPAFLTVSYFL